MGVYPSGQRGQTVNLLHFASVVRIHKLPPSKKALSFDKALFVSIAKAMVYDHTFVCISLQRQRRLETTMRAERQKIKLLEEGGASEDDILAAKARYKGTSHEYTQFSKAMELPQQRQRVNVDGIGALKDERNKSIVSSEHGISGKHKQTTSENTVDIAYIKSAEYRKKFIGITGDANIDNQIYSQAIAQLTHRDGSYGEDLTLINGTTGKIEGRQSKSRIENMVDYNNSLNNAIANNPPYSLISIHNHGTNNPPTGSDLVANGTRKYKLGIVVTHNGKVFVYKAGKKPFLATSFDHVVDKNRSKGYNEYDAIIETLKQYQIDYGIEWSER